MSRVQAVSRLLFKPPRVTADPKYKGRQCGRIPYHMVRRKPTTVSVEAINLQPTSGDSVLRSSVKKTGAWRYPNGIIQRMDRRKIGTKEYFDDKDESENRRKHESNFFITINTNRSMAGINGATAEIGKQACRRTLDWLSEADTLCTYIKFGPKNPRVYGEDRFEDVIQKVEWQANVEVGEKLERLHCHIWLTMHHFSQVQVNMPVIQHLFNRKYNEEINANTDSAGKLSLAQRGKPYVNVKLLPTSDWAMVMRQYIHKGMEAAKVPTKD